MKRWMHLAETLSEAAGAFDAFIMAARHLPDMNVHLEPWPHEGCVFISWIDGSNGAMPRLCKLADEYKVPLKLMVEIYSQRDGGKLVPYYESCGFEITSFDPSGYSTDENGNFDLSRVPVDYSDEPFDSVGMDRVPQ